MILAASPFLKLKAFRIFVMVIWFLKQSMPSQDASCHVCANIAWDTNVMAFLQASAILTRLRQQRYHNNDNWPKRQKVAQSQRYLVGSLCLWYCVHVDVHRRPKQEKNASCVFQNSFENAATNGAEPLDSTISIISHVIDRHLCPLFSSGILELWFHPFGQESNKTNSEMLK